MTGTAGRDDEALTIGVEEEYLIVDPRTRALISDSRIQEAVIAGVQARIDGSIGFVTQEFLKSQVEVGTAVCRSIGELHEKLAQLRRAVSQSAAEQGVAPIAASTHPTANWHDQSHTRKARYDVMAGDFCALADRLVICGMHVHVGVPDQEERIDLMNQASYFLPHLLTLSTSSPFWRGRRTGLMCYRLAVFDELPRTGLPEGLRSWADYQQYLDALIGLGEIEDGSKIWWDIRPSWRFPTLEMRITDVCTRLQDGVSIAALYACVLFMLRRLRRSNQRWRQYPTMLINENRWRAQRRGFSEGMIDFGKMAIVPCAELMEELIAITAEEQAALDCAGEIAHVRHILERGTSARSQLRVYQQALDRGASNEEALDAVVDWLITETMRDIDGKGTTA